MADIMCNAFATRRFPVEGPDVTVGQIHITAPQPAAIVWCTSRGHADPAPELTIPSLTVLRASAGQWLLVSEQEPAAAVLAPYAVVQAQFRLTDVSHARSRLRIRGPAVCDVLQGGIALDLGPAAFPVGASTATAFRDVPVLVHARDATVFDLYVFRSYAKTLSQWLIDSLET